MGPKIVEEGNKKWLRLLNDCSGAFRPSILTALVGSSGAGKTTLMDVLAGRKTSTPSSHINAFCRSIAPSVNYAKAQPLHDWHGQPLDVMTSQLAGTRQSCCCLCWLSVLRCLPWHVLLPASECKSFMARSITSGCSPCEDAFGLCPAANCMVRGVWRLREKVATQI